MTNPTFGVMIMNREIHETVYKDCFLGSESIDWISSHLELDRSESIVLFRLMLEEELFICVDLKRTDYFDSSKSVFKENKNKLQNFTLKYQKVLKIFSKTKTIFFYTLFNISFLFIFYFLIILY